MPFENRNELFGRSGCDIFLVEVFDEDFADIARGPEVTHFLRNAPKLDNLPEHGSEV